MDAPDLGSVFHSFEGPCRCYLHEHGLQIGYTDPLDLVPYSNLASTDFQWDRSMHGGLCLVLRFNDESQARAWLLADLMPSQAPPPSRFGSEPWRLAVEKIPRLIAATAGVPFAPPRTLQIPGFGGPKGVAVNVYPKADLAWPARCSMCMDDLPSLPPRNDTLHMDFHAMPKTSLLDLRTIIEDAEPVNLQVPYCEKCYAERHKIFKSKVSVRGWAYDGLHVTLDFMNAQYARAFVAANGGKATD